MARRRLLPSQEYLQECFDYDSDTGVLTWKERPLSHFSNFHRGRNWNSHWAGKPAGHNIKRKDGYTQNVVHVNGELHGKARVIYKLVYNLQPDTVDHRDTNSSNNRLDNLRNSTTSQNAMNKNKRSDSKSGYKGVCVITARKNKKYKATICVKGHVQHLGFFDTAEEVYKVYVEHAEKLHGEFFRP